MITPESGIADYLRILPVIIIVKKMFNPLIDS